MESRGGGLLAAALIVSAVVAAAVLLLTGGEREDQRAELDNPTVAADDRLLLGPDPRVASRAMRTLAHLGVDWVRVPASWAALAPSPRAAARPRFDPSDPDAYPPGVWTRLDGVFELAAREDLRVMVDVTGPPPAWAIGPDGPDPAAYAAFARAVARRYSGGYPGLPAAVAFAIGDAANRRAGRIGPLVEGYRERVYAAHPAIRRSAPDALVLLGNTLPFGGDAQAAVPPLRFLRELACLDPYGQPSRAGPCGRFRPLPGDAWAHQLGERAAPPWRVTADPEDVGPADLRRLTTALARLHRQGRLAAPMPVLVTAHGQPGGEEGLYRQARWLGETEWLAQRVPGVRGFAQAPLRDDPSRARRSGLELPDGRPKPAGNAFAYALVVHRAGPRRVSLWGHVRPGSGRRRFRVSVRRPSGNWSPLPQFNQTTRTEQDGTFSFFARTGPGGAAINPRSAYRLELLRDSRWQPAGLPIFGAR